MLDKFSLDKTINITWTLDENTTITWSRKGTFEFKQEDQVVVLNKYQLKTTLNRIADLLKDENLRI